MKRFHVHLVVDDLDESIAFYNKLFDTPPSRVESDYAKWMVDEPPVNFAISSNEGRAGIHHLGIEVDSADALGTLAVSASRAASGAVQENAGASCCYSVSDKHWVADPQGVLWEHFRSLEEEADVQGAASVGAESCCAPRHAGAEIHGADTPCCPPSGVQATSSLTCCSPRVDSGGG